MVLAHNEDGIDIDRNRTFLLHMIVYDRSRSNFTAYVYAGQLATSGRNLEYHSFSAFGYNRHIAFSMNYLKTSQASQ